jgi:hypothetical protein
MCRIGHTTSAGDPQVLTGNLQKNTRRSRTRGSGSIFSHGSSRIRVAMSEFCRYLRVPARLIENLKHGLCPQRKCSAASKRNGEKPCSITSKNAVNLCGILAVFATSSNVFCHISLNTWNLTNIFTYLESSNCVQDERKIRIENRAKSQKLCMLRIFVLFTDTERELQG